jgi:hypothetical protein
MEDKNIRKKQRKLVDVSKKKRIKGKNNRDVII